MAPALHWRGFMLTRDQRLAGVLFGTAVGDALGLPYEGMSRRRVRRFLARSPLAHRFVFGRGLCSDDTEHTCLVAAALAKSQGEPALFEQSFAGSLKRWLLTLPAAVGFGTLRGVVKLLLGFPPDKSGVHSAGNGPAMRAALIGVYASYDLALVRELVHRSTRITHTDPRAEQGALAIAVAAALAARHPGLDSRTLLDRVIEELDDQRLIELLLELDPERSAETIANARGLQGGVSGFVHHTVPLALHCWLRHRESFERALDEAIRLGGDTDTVAAIVGALSGAELGVSAIPKPWLEGLAEWPATAQYMDGLARSLARSEAPPPLSWPAVALRNLVFFGLVVVQGLRRALPPY